MRLWAKIWTVLDGCFLWMWDSDADALVREVAQQMPDDPREQALLTQASGRDDDQDRAAA